MIINKIRKIKSLKKNTVYINFPQKCLKPLPKIDECYPKYINLNNFESNNQNNSLS